MTEDKKRPSDKRVSLAPLDFEQALGGILRAGPHPKDDDELDPAEAIKQRHESKPKRRKKSTGGETSP